MLLPAMTCFAARNLALNRPYVLSSPPNYGLCTDDGDKTQLTDGELSDDAKMFWAQKSTVGWMHQKQPVSITIDLGAIHAIGGISLRSAGGASSVGFPAFAYIWVSDDGETYTCGGELLAASWRHGLPDDGGNRRLLRGLPNGVHRYLAEPLRLAGRFVKLTCRPGSAYLFCDEIEVLAGDFEPSSANTSDVRLAGGFEAWAGQHKGHAIAQVRMLYDLQELGQHAQAGEFEHELAGLRDEVLCLPLSSAMGASRTLPYTPLHGRIWALNGKMQRAGGAPAFSAWAASPYAPLHPFDPPPPTSHVAEVHLLGNESRPAAVNVASYADADRNAGVRVSWQGTPWPADRVRLHQVCFTEAQERVIVALGLVEAVSVGENEWRVELPAGVAGQLWLTFDSRGATRGRYTARVEITASGGATAAVPLTVEVHAGAAPDVCTLANWTWDYLLPASYPLVTAGNRDRALELLREYRVNSFWAGPAVAPGARGGARNRADGTLEIQDEGKFYRDFDRWLTFVRPAKTYFLFMHCPGGYEKLYTGGFQPGTKEHETAVRGYFTTLAAHLAQQGLDPSRFVFLAYDEPSRDDEPTRRAGRIARIARAAVPAFRFYTTPVYTGTANICRPLMENTDIICPNIGHLPFAETMGYYRQLRERSTDRPVELAVYACADGGWMRSPLGYFRALAWTAWQEQMMGMGVWAYMAARHLDTWDNFCGTGSFTMVLATGDSVTPTKMLAGWRDGVQDYETFCVLRDLAAKAQAAGKDAAAVREATQLLDNLAAQALEGLDGKWAPDTAQQAPSRALDNARLKLLRMIDRLAACVEG